MMRPGSNVEIKLYVKARKEFGFEPAVNFRRGIDRAVAWYREQGWL
jgi:nucleoside-diphosphate-sugar epimerase